jgi:hypothetical protein
MKRGCTTDFIVTLYIYVSTRIVPRVAATSGYIIQDSLTTKETILIKKEVGQYQTPFKALHICNSHTLCL